MKTRVLVMIALLVPAMALAEPDFSGTWVRDGAKVPPWLESTLAAKGVRYVD